MTESQNEDKDNSTHPRREETTSSNFTASLASSCELDTQVPSQFSHTTNVQASSVSNSTHNNISLKQNKIYKYSDNKEDSMESISYDSSYNELNMNQNMRYQLNFVWQQNKDYVINDITLGYTLIKHIDDNDKSIVFNDFPGNGKTSLCGLLEEMCLFIVKICILVIFEYRLAFMAVNNFIKIPWTIELLLKERIDY